MNLLIVFPLFLSGVILGFFTPFVFFPEKVEEWVLRRSLVDVLSFRIAVAGFSEGLREIGLLKAELDGLGGDELLDTVLYWLAKAGTAEKKWSASCYLFGRALARPALDLAEKRHGRVK